MNELWEHIDGLLAQRLAFIETELDRAYELTDPDRRHHLVIIEHQPPIVAAPERMRFRPPEPIPPAVACSWPLPPLAYRDVSDVDTGGRT